MGTAPLVSVQNTLVTAAHCSETNGAVVERCDCTNGVVVEGCDCTNGVVIERVDSTNGAVVDRFECISNLMHDVSVTSAVTSPKEVHAIGLHPKTVQILYIRTYVHSKPQQSTLSNQPTSSLRHKIA